MIEPEVWLPLVSGLVGALIGGAAGPITVVVQSRLEARKHRIAVLTELAKHESERVLELAKLSSKTFSVLPPVVFMRYYDELLKALEEGRLTLDRYRQIMSNSREFVELTKEIDREMKA